MGASQRSFGFVDRRHEVVEVLAEMSRSEFAHAVEVSIGAFGHDGEFGCDGREFAWSHGATLGDEVRTHFGPP